MDKAKAEAARGKLSDFASNIAGGYYGSTIRYDVDGPKLPHL